MASQTLIGPRQYPSNSKFAMLSPIFEDPGYARLADKEDDASRQEQAETIRRNFIVMSIAFSLNHGSAVACIAYATAELGNDLGSASSGILYVCYAISALLVSKPFVCSVGPKLALFASLTGEHSCASILTWSCSGPNLFNFFKLLLSTAMTQTTSFYQMFATVIPMTRPQ